VRTIMYIDFYRLTESPFNLTPDTNFLFPSRVHREVLTHLLYGVNSRKGFIMVTGEIGSGKTTLCRALLMKLGPSTEVALVLNSFLSELELLRTINEELGIRSTGSTKKELIDELNDFLLHQRMKGKNVALVIDEAQNLSFPVLEQIRMLSNLETEKEKLLQIVLVGQPELRRLLGSPRLRQLNQRITVRHHVTPLTRKETVQYIYHRLKVAGSSGNIVFSNSALNEIYRFSGGIPRMINVVCDQALLGGYVANSMKIDHKIVGAAETEIEGIGKQPRRFLGRDFSVARVGATVGLVLATCVIALATFGPGIQKILFPETSPRSDKTPALRTARSASPKTVAHSPANVNTLSQHEPEENGSGAPPPDEEATAVREAPQAATPAGRAAALAPASGRPAARRPGTRAGSEERKPSLMRLAFLSGATVKLGQTLPRVLGSDMKPLFSRKSSPLAALPPRPKVKLPKTPSLRAASDRRVVAYRSFVEPMFSLMRLWKRTPATIQAVRQRYEQVGGHFPSLATAAGMGWVSLRANPQTLRMIDIPAIVEIAGGSDDQKGYVTFVATGETWVEVVTAEGRKRLDTQLFSEVYAGNAIVLCDDDFVNPTPLRQGQGISLSVRKLQDYMKGAGYFDANPSGWFTPQTTAAVMAFQRDQGLPASGEADGRTKLLLYASQGKSGVPHLYASR